MLRSSLDSTGSSSRYQRCLRPRCAAEPPDARANTPRALACKFNRGTAQASRRLLGRGWGVGRSKRVPKPLHIKAARSSVRPSCHYAALGSNFESSINQNDAPNLQVFPSMGWGVNSRDEAAVHRSGSFTSVSRPPLHCSMGLSVTEHDGSSM
ncbi:hypothetical protein NDU88_001360 [Pleurodeles waltl]|uniref:Uncharacterized protein n=1 Tax=Pleurodeles waltl TaxID=8319 RepID=A0AAV7NJU3_PLEWA|nr:hypothetical protein NDU88_001360 [Pleurodeles waltl]